jgi:hypothetical protein
VYATAAAARAAAGLAWLNSLDGYEALMVTAGELLHRTAGRPTGR